jgi:acyl carrier protein
MTADRHAILNDLQDIVRDSLDNEAITISEKTRPADVPGWDSMAHINIVIAVEERFGVRFSSADLARLRGDGQAIDALVDLISERLQSS